MKDITAIRNSLSGKGLKVTPQRMVVLEAIHSLQNHPTADQILNFVRNRFPNISTGTVYKILDTLVSSNLIMKVKTESDIMRYDGEVKNHHHIYCVECDQIEDYENPVIDDLLKKFFEENGINNFIIEDVRLQINGKFTNHKANI